jgi:hypothetical protein
MGTLRHRVKSYTMHRKGKNITVKGHLSKNPRKK